VLPLCYHGVTVILQWCPSGVILTLQWCLCVLQYCYSGVPTVAYQPCNKSVCVTSRSVLGASRPGTRTGRRRAGVFGRVLGGALTLWCSFVVLVCVVTFVLPYYCGTVAVV
jgi:hypothetical protein